MTFLEKLGAVADPASCTFLQVPHATELDAPDVVVLGIPFDIGTHPYRVGSRQGPDHVRQMSRELRPNLVELDETAFNNLRISDAGNVNVTASKTAPAYVAIQQACSEILKVNAVPATIGGDGSVTLPLLRAVAEVYGRDELAVIHLDAHTDAHQGSADEPYTNATTFVRAVEEGLLDPKSCIHVGVRGTSPVPNSIGYARETGFEVITTTSLRARGPGAVAQELASRFKGRPVYVCWDMDIFDPSVAPGVCTPEWGGLSAADGIDFIRALGGIRPVAIDVNTVSPPHDPADVTSSLAARIMLELLYLIANEIDVSKPFYDRTKDNKKDLK